MQGAGLHTRLVDGTEAAGIAYIPNLLKLHATQAVAIIKSFPSATHAGADVSNLFKLNLRQIALLEEAGRRRAPDTWLAHRELAEPFAEHGLLVGLQAELPHPGTEPSLAGAG
jgi:hypothetical protein